MNTIDPGYGFFTAVLLFGIFDGILESTISGPTYLKFVIMVILAHLGFLFNKYRLEVAPHGFEVDQRKPLHT